MTVIETIRLIASILNSKTVLMTIVKAETIDLITFVLNSMIVLLKVIETIG